MTQAIRSRIKPRLRINPATNGGERAEISCRLLNSPKSPRNPLDADYRYSLGRGDRWLYVYAILEHKPGFPAFSVAELTLQRPEQAIAAAATAASRLA